MTTAILKPLRLHIEPITAEPFDLELIRDHGHIDSIPGTFQDDLLRKYMRAAIAWFEGETHRTVIQRSHRWVLECFPYVDYQQIQLPRGKTQSVESVQYWSGQSQVTLTGPSASPPGTGFRQDLKGIDGGIVMPPYGSSWPGHDLDAPDPVVCNFTAGYAAASVPEDMLQALLFYVSDANELRGTADVDLGRYGKYSNIRELMISGYRLHRWYG